MFCLFCFVFANSLYTAIPISDAEKSSHVAIVITARGGHIGFLEGWWPTSKDQYMGRLFSQYFSAVLHDQEGDFQRTAEKMMASQEEGVRQEG